MGLKKVRQQNHAAFRYMKAEIDRRFSPGHFLAFDEGNVVADTPTYDALTDALIAIGKNRPDVLVVQAGVDYPESAIILVALDVQ